MGFFDDLGKKTSEKTAKITREAKLKYKISENKSKAKDLYIEIGKKVYEKHVREEDIIIKDFMQEECEKLDTISKEIEDARKEILTLNNKIICEKCFAEIDKDSNFCPKCGDKKDIKEPATKEMEEKQENSQIQEDKKEEE